MERKLTRIPSEAVVGGVAAGMSDYFGIDRTIIRVLWVVLLLLPIPPNFFWTAVVYIIFWAALPEGLPGGNGMVDGTVGNQNVGSGPYTSTSQPNSSDPDRSIKIIGVVLLGVGAILLLDELPYWYQIREYIWPVALILGGAYLLLRQRDKEQFSGTTNTPPPADPFSPHDPFPPTEPDPVPYRPFDTQVNNPSIEPDAPSDPDGETDPSDEPPKIR